MLKFFCIDDAQPCQSQCRACKETVSVNNAYEADRRAAFDRMADIAGKSQDRAIEAIQPFVELERDAERYRWLRNLGKRADDLPICASGPGFVVGEDFDRVIDLAMEKE
jgi:hypothetical protein